MADCTCNVAPKIIFACSGAADVGAITDQTARKLTRDGVGRMYCLAGIGGGVAKIVEGARSAGRIMALDGCDQDCARYCLERAGFTGFIHLRMTDLGMEKGKTPVSPEQVEQVAGIVAARLNTTDPAPAAPA